jgi:hypothetical protein
VGRGFWLRDVARVTARRRLVRIPRGTGGTFPFAIQPLHAVAADGSRSVLVTVALDGPDRGSFRVTTFDAVGGTVHILRFPFDGVAIRGPSPTARSTHGPESSRTRIFRPSTAGRTHPSTARRSRERA